MPKGGPREGAGRPRGSRGRRTKDSITKAEALGPTPLEVLLESMLAGRAGRGCGLRQSGCAVRASETCPDITSYSCPRSGGLQRAVRYRTRPTGENLFEAAQAATGQRSAAGAISRDARTLSSCGFVGRAVGGLREWCTCVGAAVVRCAGRTLHGYSQASPVTQDGEYVQRPDHGAHFKGDRFAGDCPSVPPCRSGHLSQAPSRRLRERAAPAWPPISRPRLISTAASKRRRRTRRSAGSSAVISSSIMRRKGLPQCQRRRRIESSTKAKIGAPSSTASRAVA
jgi:hypothetical protein